MASNSNVTIVGNLTRDPELRFTPSGQATATFGVAVNRSWQNRQTQEWQEQTSFFDVVCWAQLAENAAQSLSRGSRVVVTGRLEQRSWETQDGEKRTKVEIVADEVAPSIRWATVAISKNERRNAEGGGTYGSSADSSGASGGDAAGGGAAGGGAASGGAGDGGAGGGGGGAGGGGAGAPGNGPSRPPFTNEPPAEYHYEEEPF